MINAICVVAHSTAIFFVELQNYNTYKDMVKIGIIDIDMVLTSHNSPCAILYAACCKKRDAKKQNQIDVVYSEDMTYLNIGGRACSPSTLHCQASSLTSLIIGK